MAAAGYNPATNLPRQSDAVNEHETRAERREEKRRKRRQMRVAGRSVRLLQEIVRRRSEKLSEKDG